jgi:hypothetical protein
MSTKSNDVKDSNVSINKSTIESALINHRIHSEFQKTADGYSEITGDDQRQRSIKNNSVIGTCIVKTTVFGDTKIEEFSSAEDAVNHIKNNKIYDIGTDIEGLFDRDESTYDLIGSDVKENVTKISNCENVKVGAIRAIRFLSGLQPREAYNPTSVFSNNIVADEHPDTIIYDITSGEYTGDIDEIPDVESNPEYDELISALEVCNAMDVIDSIEVDSYEHRTTFTVYL